MKYLITTLAILATFAAAGQTTNPFPYNPDADADGWISVNDLLSLLSIFTSEFTPESWETDSLSAAVVLNGNINYFECQRACHELEGHWRMADMDAFGKHWNLVAGENANHWVNSNSSLGSHDYNEFFEINGYGSIYSVSSPDLSLGKKCMCHLQSSPFVPDVLTSETAGLQEQIDSLNAQQTLLTDMLASMDSLQANLGGNSQYSLECVEMGVGHYCDSGAGFNEWSTLEPIDGYRYPVNYTCNCNVSQDLVSPNWRKFKIHGLPAMDAPVLLVFHKYNNDYALMDDRSLQIEDDGSYSFYTYGSYSYSSNPCSPQGGYPLGVAESNTIGVTQNNSVRRNLTLWVRDGNSIINTDILLSH